MAIFINPIPNSYVTSPFGYRSGGWHQGIDISIEPKNNVQVRAAADGKIIRVGPLNSYGNIVMIQHTIDGKRMDTNYAHLASWSVQVGQTVKQGEVIGIMGSTGASTGPHLHFEIHNGAWVTGQRNAVDPAQYIKFYSKGELEKMEKQLQEQANKINELEKELGELKATVEKIFSNKDAASDYAVGALKFATDLGIMKGDNEGNLLPHAAIKRQDMAIIFQRFYNLIK